MESVDLEARIIGETELAGLAGVIEGLDGGVLVEVGAVLVGFVEGPLATGGEIGEADDQEAGRGAQNGAEFVNLVRVVGGEDDFDG